MARKSRGIDLGVSARGFTLVELTIVVLTLAILAAMVMPRITNATTEAEAATAATNLAMIQQQVNRYNAEHGVYPTLIDPNWFVRGKLPINPFVPDATGGYYAEGGGRAWKVEPTDKTARATSNTHWWYNPNNGAVRARVSQQDSDEATLALYNRVNGRSIPSLDYVGNN